MPITIAKDAGSGSGNDTTFSINHFDSLRVVTDTNAAAIPDLVGDESDGIIIAELGPTMVMYVVWTIIDESSSVVTGAGGTVQTAIEQVNYLHSVLRSGDEGQITDAFTLEIEYEGGSTFSRDGRIIKIQTEMAAKQPLTFQASLDFAVGTTA